MGGLYRLAPGPLFGYKAPLEKIPVKSMHLSCKSDEFNGNEDYVGMVLYMHDGKTRWKLNRIRCQTGYVYFKKTRNIDKVKSELGIVHGKLYVHLFGKAPPQDSSIVASGFSYRVGDGEWHHASGVFNGNCKSGYHWAGRDMHKLEQEIITVVAQLKPGATVELES